MQTNVKAGGTRYIGILCIENKAGVWGQSPQPPEANGGLEAEPPTLRRFYSLFLKKKYAFFGIVWSTFCVFKWLNKVLMRSQGFRPGAPTALAKLLSEKAKTVHLLSLYTIIVF